MTIPSRSESWLDSKIREFVQCNPGQIFLLISGEVHGEEFSLMARYFFYMERAQFVCTSNLYNWYWPFRVETWSETAEH